MKHPILQLINNTIVRWFNFEDDVGILGGINLVLLFMQYYVFFTKAISNKFHMFLCQNCFTLELNEAPHLSLNKNNQIMSFKMYFHFSKFLLYIYSACPSVSNNEIFLCTKSSESKLL